MSDQHAYPQHSPAQEKEERSKRLLEQLSPKDWKIRPVLEGDVGIDGEVEVRESDRYKGVLFKYQLKSTDRINWNHTGHSRSNTIKVSTANYWLAIEIPTFLFQADLSEGSIYFQPVGPELRMRFDEIQQQKSLTIELDRQHCLGQQSTVSVFNAAFSRERGLPHLVGLADQFLSRFENWAVFLELSQGRDSHMEADENVRDEIRPYYEFLIELGALLGFSSLEPFDDVISRHERELGCGGGFHEYTATKLCRAIEVRMAGCARSLIDTFGTLERAYWHERMPRLVRQCDQLGSYAQQFQKRVEIDSVSYRRRLLGPIKSGTYLRVPNGK